VAVSHCGQEDFRDRALKAVGAQDGRQPVIAGGQCQGGAHGVTAGRRDADMLDNTVGMRRQRRGEHLAQPLGTV